MTAGSFASSAEAQYNQNFNYELFNCNNFNIRFWSWNYRGCWHQTCPPIAFGKVCKLSSLHFSTKVESCYFLSLPPRIGIGQFSRLLPSVDVVAISQAPSPESNPNSPLPVIAMVVQYTTIQSWLGRNLNDLSQNPAIRSITMIHHIPEGIGLVLIITTP